MSSAAFRPSPVIFSMLSTAGSTRSFFNRSARSVRVRMNAFSSGLAGAATIAGLPFSSAGRGRFSMSAVCTSATVRNTESNSGRLMNLANRVCIRYPDPSGASSSDVTASAKFAAHGSKCSTFRSDSISGAR